MNTKPDKESWEEKPKYWDIYGSGDWSVDKAAHCNRPKCCLKACGKNNSNLMVRCDGCGQWEHFVCAGIKGRNDNEYDEDYICGNCNDRSSIVTDTNSLHLMPPLTPSKRIDIVIKEHQQKQLHDDTDTDIISPLSPYTLSDDNIITQADNEHHSDVKIVAYPDNEPELSIVTEENRICSNSNTGTGPSKCP